MSIHASTYPYIPGFDWIWLIKMSKTNPHQISKKFTFANMYIDIFSHFNFSPSRRNSFWAWLADNFKSGSTVVASLICPPLVYSMTDSCDAKFGHSPMNIKSGGDDDWIFHMWDLSQATNILFWVCSQIVMKINESFIL